jgi:hypothetical protein
MRSSIKNGAIVKLQAQRRCDEQNFADQVKSENGDPYLKQHLVTIKDIEALAGAVNSLSKAASSEDYLGPQQSTRLMPISLKLEPRTPNCEFACGANVAKSLALLPAVNNPNQIAEC